MYSGSLLNWRRAFFWFNEYRGIRSFRVKIHDAESNKIFRGIPVEQYRSGSINSHFISNVGQLTGEREREREREREMRSVYLDLCI